MDQITMDPEVNGSLTEDGRGSGENSLVGDPKLDWRGPLGMDMAGKAGLIEAACGWAELRRNLSQRPRQEPRAGDHREVDDVSIF
jgi:hypothetical protein